MKNIQESRKGISSHIADLGLIHERFVEESSCILRFCLLLLLLFFIFLFTLLLFALLLDALLRSHCCARDVEPHLNQLIWAGGGLPPPVTRATGRLAIGFVCLVTTEAEFNGDLVLSRKVGIGDLGVGDFERRPV